MNYLDLLAFSNPLRPLEHFLTRVLVWLHESVGFSWAWSIVALTVIVRILLVPITVKQIHSMQALQAHAPEMKALQQKWKHDKQRQNEELMKFYKENKINPAASCLPIVLQIPIFISLFYVLRHFDEKVLPLYGGSVDWLHLVDITEPVKDGWGPLLLVIYVASQLSSSYFMSSTMQGAQRILLMVLPVLFVPFILNFPAGLMLYWLTTNLWTTGQGLVTRRLMPKPVVPEKRSSRTPAKDEPPATNGSGSPGRRESRRDSGTQAGCRPAAARQAQARRREQQEMTTEVSVEATGETVGEAKWSAVRELQRRVPGLDRDAIRFQVISEGERGLLGVGYTPASVVATADIDATVPSAPTPTEGDTSQAGVVRELLERTIAASGVAATVQIDEAGDELVATIVGPDLGVLIGRHGQTIDALQYLANAIGHRTQGGDRPRVVVDAAGYRARRAATLDAAARRAAEQATATGQRVELEAMTAVERRIVHELLKDDPEVETTSEGTEPTRFVVVIPRRSAD